jgi:enoyl-CoA hydratase/carnithine racemase
MDKSNFTVTYEDGPHIATVTLTRSEAGNRLTIEDIPPLGKAILAAGSLPDIKVVMVKAQGEQFCMGRDPGQAAPTTKSALQTRNDVTAPILGLYADLRATPVPVVAVVQGEARGFGCAFVGQCDLAIAAEHATFSLPEMDTNLPPTLAISAVLGKLPPKRLTHLIYTREKIEAKEALELGLLSEVVPAAELQRAALKTIARLTDRSRPALEAVKEYMAVAPHLDPDAASRYASALLSVVLSSKG